MGLDWCLRRTDNEEASPLELIGAERADLDNVKHREIMDGIIRSHRDQLDQTSLDHYARYWSRPDDEIYEDMKGQVLVDTIDLEHYKAHLPAFANPFPALSGVEAFRGERVQFCEILPDDVRGAAFEDRDADSMSDYADQLESYLTPERLELVKLYDEIQAQIDENPDAYEPQGFFIWDEDKEGKIDPWADFPEEGWHAVTLRDAVQWLRFWSQFPVKLHAWY